MVYLKFGVITVVVKKKKRWRSESLSPSSTRNRGDNEMVLGDGESVIDWLTENVKDYNVR
jgi:hypothetical protein